MRKVISIQCDHFGILAGRAFRKTGTAQKTVHANHGLFIGFSHYESRDAIALAVRIPFGYSSMNAELVAKDILDYYYGLSDDILSGQATQRCCKRESRLRNFPAEASLGRKLQKKDAF